MMRIAIPYGTLDARRLRTLADVSERFDKGEVHFTTRQNVQLHWPSLTDTPAILQALAEADLHAVQTSGSCIRAVTADHLAGAALDEIEDPRPTAELIRQWSSDHPEFAFLPRKFKIAVTGATEDRAVTAFHDIGLKIVAGADGNTAYRVSVGGGLGRTPMIGHEIRDALPKADLLDYLEAILIVYNRIGRRDNKYKARIKITVHEHGIDRIRDAVESEFARIRGTYPAGLATLHRIERDFAPPDWAAPEPGPYQAARANDPVFRAFTDINVARHRQPGYGILTITLKRPGETPGDMSADQMRLVAELAEAYAHDDIRVSHEQNLVLPHVPLHHLPAIHARLRASGLATANAGLLSDLIACPGMDFCDLATARSIPVARNIARRIEELGRERDIGPIRLKISGCVNACGHHHVGHIGILGLEKAGIESYQITLGGDAGDNASIGERLGPGFGADRIVGAVETVIETYLARRLDVDETFLEAWRRLGPAPFKSALYPEKEPADAP